MDPSHSIHSTLRRAYSVLVHLPGDLRPQLVRAYILLQDNQDRVTGRWEWSPSSPEVAGIRDALRAAVGRHGLQLPSDVRQLARAVLGELTYKMPPWALVSEDIKPRQTDTASTSRMLP
jgi:hypothetical protein